MTRAVTSTVVIMLALALAACTVAQQPTATPQVTGTPVATTPGPPTPAARTLRLSSLVGPTTPDSLTLQWWAEQLNSLSGGSLTVEFFFSGSLLPGPETLHGVSDGRADLGVVPTSFHPGELPLSSLSSVPFVTSNTGAYTATFREMYLNDPNYRAEWDRQGVVPVVWLSNPPPIIGVAEPAASLDDLRGRQIRGFGYITDAMNAVGINAIALPIGEVYESVQRGVIDGYSAVPFEFVTALSLHEVAPHTIGAGLGQYGITALVMRKDLWDSLPADLQNQLVELQLEVMTRQQEQFLTVGGQVCDTLLEDPDTTVTLLPDTDIEEWRTTIGDSLFEKWKTDVGGAGVAADAADAFRTAYLNGIAEHEDEWEVRLSVNDCAAR